VTNLNADLERRTREIDLKMAALDALEARLEDKDALIRDQAQLIEQYRYLKLNIQY
jgi:hypothetical protein